MWAFWELNTTRAESGPISFLNIHKFAKIYNIDCFDDFLYFMRRLDMAFIEKNKKTTKDK